MNTSELTIKNTYHDALFFATASINEKEKFHLPPAELRVLEKLLHYSKAQENITWSSENISKHIFTSVTSIDKSIQRLKKKGYINVSTTQIFEKVKSRTIFINWDMLEKINQLVLEYNKPIESELDSTETPDTTAIETVCGQEPIQPESIELETEEFEDDEEDIFTKIKRFGYSDIEFVNMSGQCFFIPNIFKNHWEAISTKKGHANKLKRNSSQFDFDYDLSKIIENS